MRIKIIYVRIYFYIILLFSSFLSFFGNRYVDIYGSLILMFSTFPIFAILSNIYFIKFSDQIESKFPELFNKYKMHYGVVRRINGFDIFNNNDFENIDDQEIKDNLTLTKQLFGLTIKSFIVIIIFAVCFMLLKR